MVLAGQYCGEGKSFLLAPLRSIFGVDGVQESPQFGNFPLLGLEEKSVVLLDEWVFDETVLSLATQLLWFEGKPFPVVRPQNQAGIIGHAVYQGTAPMFITTKGRDLQYIQNAAETAWRMGQPSAHTMLLRRLHVYTLQAWTPVMGDVTIPECATCWSRMVLHFALHAR